MWSKSLFSQTASIPKLILYTFCCLYTEPRSITALYLYLAYIPHALAITSVTTGLANDLA
ncbi:hypothetical protein BJX70DRAFT_361787 [Aspergillus crustosus]